MTFDRLTLIVSLSKEYYQESLWHFELYYDSPGTHAHVYGFIVMAGSGFSRLETATMKIQTASHTRIDPAHKKNLK